MNVKLNLAADTHTFYFLLDKPLLAFPFFQFEVICMFYSEAMVIFILAYPFIA